VDNVTVNIDSNLQLLLYVQKPGPIITTVALYLIII